MSSSSDLVFISYSREDEEWKNRLLTHLKPAMRKGKVKTWSDDQIRAGAKWWDDIEDAMERSRAAVLLVTPTFLASDFIYDNELTPLLKEAEEGGVKILWIPVIASSYKHVGLDKYQALSDPKKPLSEMGPELDRKLVQICERIEQALHP